MAEVFPPSGSLQPYAHGYRDGFRDGFSSGRTDGPDAPGAGAAPPKDDPSKADGTPDRGDKPEKSEKSEKSEKGDKDDKSDKGDDDKKDAAPGDGKTPLYKRPLVVALGLAILLGLIVAAIVFWRQSKQHESTDDAFIDGHASAVASQAAGRVLKLHVVDNQTVKAGDLLVEIDSRDADANLAQSRARLADAEGQLATARAQVVVRRASIGEAAAQTRQAQAELAKAEQDLARFRGVDPAAIARQQTDAASTTVQSARARLDAARSSERSALAQVAAAETQVRTAEAGVEASRATIQSAEVQVSYARVVAPIDGHVTRRTIEVGNVVSAGQPLMSIVSDQLWVTANYKETQLARMSTGLAVDIVVDAFPDAHFRGHVDSVQRGTGSYFSMLPAENATGNYVKVVQRVPVKIVFDELDKMRRYPIGLGMSVKPDVQLP